ncbi:MAG: HAD hydrolase-like protein [Parcubacteria group bacterium]
MKIFIDFDDVLFNTKKFKDDYLEVFAAYGISKEVFERFYYDPQSVGGIKKYDPIRHIGRIFKKEKEIGKNLEKSVMDFVSDTSRYVFPDVTGFLKKFRKEELFIVSYSLTDFQKAKISNSGIGDFFKAIEIGSELKEKAVAGLIDREGIDLSKENVYFIEDRISHIESVKRKYPVIRTILLKRKEGRYADGKNELCDFEVENLEQAEKIILR